MGEINKLPEVTQLVKGRTVFKPRVHNSHPKLLTVFYYSFHLVQFLTPHATFVFSHESVVALGRYFVAIYFFIYLPLLITFLLPQEGTVSEFPPHRTNAFFAGLN